MLLKLLPNKVQAVGQTVKHGDFYILLTFDPKVCWEQSLLQKCWLYNVKYTDQQFDIRYAISKFMEPKQVLTKTLTKYLLQKAEVENMPGTLKNSVADKWNGPSLLAESTKFGI